MQTRGQSTVASTAKTIADERARRASTFLLKVNKKVEVEITAVGRLAGQPPMSVR
jgi:hypothetical protein